MPEALVIAVGPGAPNRDGVLVPVALKAGDRVVLPGFGGVGVKVGEEVSTVYVTAWRVCVLIMVMLR